MTEEEYLKWEREREVLREEKKKQDELLGFQRKLTGNIYDLLKSDMSFSISRYDFRDELSRIALKEAALQMVTLHEYPSLVKYAEAMAELAATTGDETLLINMAKLKEKTLDYIGRKNETYYKCVSGANDQL